MVWGSRTNFSMSIRQLPRDAINEDRALQPKSYVISCGLRAGRSIHHLSRQTSLGLNIESPVGKRQQALLFLFDMMMDEIPKLPAER